MAGPVIEATVRTKYEDGLRPESPEFLATWYPTKFREIFGLG